MAVDGLCMLPSELPAAADIRQRGERVNKGG